jgi:16S rRNA G1207 methylase RsmC
MSQHYFTHYPKVASQPSPVHVALRGVDVTLLSDRGVFSYGHLDHGTELLLRGVPDPPEGEVLDLGCGYGPIAITMALLAPEARVWGVDVNRRAVDLTRRNAVTAGAANVIAVTQEALPDDITFSAIYSNPPVRLGKGPLHQMLLRWLPRLREDGAAFLVVQRHLGADTLAAWLAGVGYMVRRVRSRQGYRLLEVRRGLASPHDGARDS